MSTTLSTSRGRRLPGPALVGAAFGLSTLVNIAFEVGSIVFSDADPYRSEGPVETIQGMAIFGGIGLVVALAVALPCAGNAARAKVGAVVLGALAVVSLVVFWSGAPAALGAAAAWLAGFARGAEPQTGVARGFGVVGLVVAALVVVVGFAGHVAAAVAGAG